MRLMRAFVPSVILGVLATPFLVFAGTNPDLSIGYAWDRIPVLESEAYNFPTGQANTRSAHYTWPGGNAYGQVYRGSLHSATRINGHFLGNASPSGGSDYFPAEDDYFVVIFNVPAWADAQWLGRVETWFASGTTVNASAHPPLNWGIIKFKVGVEGVELYTQIVSPFPSETRTQLWADLPYANGAAADSCGSFIRNCGCALTSAVMVARYYGITDTTHGPVDPLAMNAWLQDNNGYLPGGGVDWNKIAKYTDDRIRLGSYDGVANNFPLVDASLAESHPVIVRTNAEPIHFFVIDRKLASSYRVRDPRWYNTQTLDDAIGAPGAIDYIGQRRDYQNSFNAARVYLPHDGTPYASLTFALGSPAELLITDSEGRRLGKDAVGNSYNEILGASYGSDDLENPDDPNAPPPAHRGKVAYLSSAGSNNFTVEVIGTGDGPYTLQTTFSDTAGNSTTTTIGGEIETGEIVLYEASFDATNADESNIEPVSVDDTPPAITVAAPTAQTYALNQVVAADYSCTDTESAVSECAGTVANDAPIDTASVGEKTFSVHAADTAGNAASTTVIYKVGYVFGGFLSPFVNNAATIKKNTSLPVKFTLTDSSGARVSTATARLSVNGVPGKPSSSANTGDLFRFDAATGQYVYNLSAQSLVRGNNTLVVQLDDGAQYSATVFVK